MEGLRSESADCGNAAIPASDLILSFLGTQQMDKESLLETSPKNEVADMDILEWKPSTSLSILHPRTPIEACDILDKAFGGLFLNELKEEIHQNDIISRLKPARTAMDNQMKEMNELLATNLQLPNYGDLDIFSKLHGKTKSARDDLSVIVPRSFRSTDTFRRKYPNFFRLITSIENTAKKNLSKTTMNKNKNNSTWIDFDSSMTSVQLASYPGDGKSGYARHCDTGASCSRYMESTRENTSLHSSNNNSNADGLKGPQRIITAVYYITEDDWCRDSDGGCLRIFENSHDGQEDHYDIAPYADRLVLFRSDLVEHQVLPSMKRTRFAITVWLYGHLVIEPNIRSCQVQSPVINQPEKISDNLRSTAGTGIPLPLPPLEKLRIGKQSREAIFVSIPAYKDTETHPTIFSLIHNAKFPQRVFVGVVYQYDVMSTMERSKYQEAPLPTPWNESNFRSITLDYRAATGPCYARYLGQSLHRGEEYILQIDSHMRFRPNWDVYLIDQLQKCHNPRKAVLTTYPPGYYLPNDIPEETRATILTPWKFDSKNILRQKGRLLEQRSDSKVLKSTGNDNIPCLLFAGGFNFSMSNILSICPYEELHYLFFGEELSMAVRLYTHGYDLYAPPQSVCYHLWSRNHRPTFQADIGVSSTDNCEDDDKYENLAPISRDRVYQQLLGNVDDLGTIRTASDFADALKVDFTNFVIKEDAVDAGLDPASFAASHTAESSSVNRTSELLETILGIVSDNQV